MPTDATDIALLRSAIDWGDDTALGPLSDALEEAGDARAAGLRRVEDRRPDEKMKWGWGSDEEWKTESSDLRLVNHVWTAIPVTNHWVIPAAAHARLPGGFEGFRERYYPTRSAAFLALAEALAWGRLGAKRTFGEDAEMEDIR